MTPRRLLLAAGFLIAGWLAFFGDKTPSGAVVQPQSRAVDLAAGQTSAARAAQGKPEQAARIPPILVLKMREAFIGDGKAGAAGRALFGSASRMQPQQAASPVATPPVPAVPSAPGLPFVYLGKQLSGGAWEVYLAHGEQILVVRENMVIETIYRVDAIASQSMTVTYLPLHQVQTLNFGEPG